MSEEKPDLPKIEMLESAPHFSYLTFEDKSELVESMTVEEFLPGDVLIHEGEGLVAVLFLFEGSVEVMKTSAEGERVRLATLGRGEIIGESAIYPETENASVLIRALEKTKALSLPGENFRRIASKNPRLAFRLMFDMMKLLRRRLTDVSNRLADIMAGGR
ncbi:MAG: cyclic nucleotide-binding domain-containing protein [Candidatus Nitrospinota bacterium M3_3B_026]